MIERAIALGLACGLVSCAAGPQKIDCLKLVNDAKRVIRTLDTDHDGTISRAEWGPYEADMLAQQKGVATQHGASSSPSDVTAIFGELDTNRDGQITLIELTRGLCPTAF